MKSSLAIKNSSKKAKAGSAKKAKAAVVAPLQVKVAASKAAVSSLLPVVSR